MSAIDLRKHNLHTRLNSGSNNYYNLSVDKNADITIRNGSIYTNNITISGRVRLEGVKFYGRTSAGTATSKVTLTVPRDGELWIYDNCSFDNVNLVIEEGGTVRVYGNDNTLNGDFTNRGTLTEQGNITVDGDVNNYASGRITTGTFQRFVQNRGTIHQYNNNKTTFNATVMNAGTITGGTFNKGVTNARGATIGAKENEVYGYIPVFNGEVTNLGTINLGTFNSSVTNRKDAAITGGTYTGRVNNIGTISGGTFTGEAASETGKAREWGATNEQTLGGQFTVTGGDFSKAKQRHGIYEIKFDLQGGTDSYGSCANQYRSATERVFATEPQVPTLSGKAFQGWYTQPTGQDNEYRFSQVVNHDITLYARWEKTYITTDCDVTVSGFTYDGKLHSVNVKVRDRSHNYDLIEGVDFEVTGDVEKRDVGTYTVTVTGLRNYVRSKEVTWTIDKASQTITAEDMSLTVGSSETINRTSSNVGGVSYEVVKGKDVVIVDGTGRVTALKGGTATVQVSAFGDNNYYGAHADVTVNVSLGNLSISWPSVGRVYVDDESEPALTGGSATLNGQNVAGAFSISGAANTPTDQQKQVTITFTPEDVEAYGVATTTRTVSVRSYTVAEITTMIPDVADKPVGTEIEDLGLPTHVQIRASAYDPDPARVRADRYYEVPVIWKVGTSGYNATSTEEQRIRGLLDLSEISGKVMQPGSDVYAWAKVTLQPHAKQSQTLEADDVYLAYKETGKAVALKADSEHHGTLSYAVASGSDVISVDGSTGAITTKKAGAATVTITAAGDNTHEPGSVTVNVIVSKAMPDVTNWPTVSPVYVNDSAAPTISGGTASIPGSFHLSSATSWTEAGDKSVQLIFTPDDDDNYGTAITDATVSVRKRTVERVTTTIAPITDKYYDTALADLGLPATVSIRTTDGKTFTDVPVTWSGYDSAKTDDAQTLTGRLDLTGISGEVENNAGVTARASVTLQKLTIDENHHTFSNKTAQYTGGAITHQLDQLHDGVASVAYSYQGAGGTAYGPSSEGPTNVGTYTVTAAFTMKSGYEQLADLTSTLTITKANQRLTATDVTGSFGDTSLKVTATGASTPLTYAVVEGADVISVDATTGAITTLRPGTAIVRASAAASDTHNAAETDVTVTVHTKYLGLASVTTAPKAKDLTYNGADQVLVESGVAEGGTMAYSLDAQNWTDALPTGKAAGTYEVFYKALGDENHDDSPAASITVTIKAARPSGDGGGGTSGETDSGKGTGSTDTDKPSSAGRSGESAAAGSGESADPSTPSGKTGASTSANDAEKRRRKAGSGTVPQTNDDTNSALAGVLVAVGVGAIGLAVFAKRRNYTK